MALIHTTATAHATDGAPSGLFPGAFHYNALTGSVVFRVAGPGTPGIPLDVPIAGPGAGGTPVGYTFVGPGTHVIPDDATVVFCDPQGGAQDVELPVAADRLPYLPVQIVVIGPGTVQPTAPGGDALFTDTTTYVMQGVNSVLELTPTLAVSWRKTAQVGSPVDFLCYVDGTTGNDANTGTLASPVQTVQEAQRRASQCGAQKSATVEIAQGAYVLDQTLNTPGVGPFSIPLVLRGSYTAPTSYAANTITPGTARSLAQVSTLTALIPNALRDGRLTWTSGALAGQSFGIESNTVNDIVLISYNALAGAAPGDTFDVELLQTSLSAPFLLLLPGASNALALRQMYFDVGVLAAYDFLVSVSEVAFRTTGGLFFQTAAGLESGGGAYSCTISNDGPSPQIPVTIGRSSLGDSSLRGISVQAFEGNALQMRGSAWSNTRLFAMTGAGVSASSIVSSGVTLASGTYVFEANGGSIDLRNATLNATLGDAVLCAQRNGDIYMEGVTGVGNDAPAVQALTGGIITVLDPGPGGTDIEGGPTPVQVGGNPPTTWAAIALGAPADTTDTAQLARVGT